MKLESESAAAGIDAFVETIAGRAWIVMPLKNQFYGLRECAIEHPDGYVIFFAQRIA